VEGGGGREEHGLVQASAGQCSSAAELTWMEDGEVRRRHDFMHEQENIIACHVVPSRGTSSDAVSLQCKYKMQNTWVH
jgi:hypothetical protein